MGRNEAATVATRVLKTPSAKKFLESSGSGWKDASARARLGERARVGWAWLSVSGAEPSRLRAAHALPPGRHGDRTRSAPAPALAGSPGAAPASWRPWRHPRERRVQVMVPSLPPLPISVLWSLSGASLAAPVKERSGRTAGGSVFNLGAWGHLKSWYQ